MSKKPKFFADTHIAKAVAIQLRNQGIDILRCEEVNLETATDHELLRYAADHRRVLISCDEDFRQLHFSWLAEGKAHAGIVKLDQERHCQNLGRLIKVIELLYEISMTEEDTYNQLFDGKDFEA